MTDPTPRRPRDDEWKTWGGVWITNPPGQVFALSERPGYVWVAVAATTADAGIFHEVAIADLVVAEQGTLL